MFGVFYYKIMFRIRFYFSLNEIKFWIALGKGLEFYKEIKTIIFV